jgi:hypothetical protein
MTKLIVAFRNFVKAPKNHLPLTEREVLFLDYPARILFSVNNDNLTAQLNRRNVFFVGYIMDI